jgi:hypothetical protein
MGCEKLVAHSGEKRKDYKVLVGKPERNRLLEDLGIVRTILLTLIVNKWEILGSSGSGKGQTAGCCEHANKLTGYTKRREPLNVLRTNS